MNEPNFENEVANGLKQKGSFFSPEEMVYDLMVQLSSDELLELKSLAKGQLIMLQLTLGMSIRNHYRLWYEDNPYTVTDPEPNGDGVLDHPMYPDQVSQSVIETLWEYLQ